MEAPLAFAVAALLGHGEVFGIVKVFAVGSGSKFQLHAAVVSSRSGRRGSCPQFCRGNLDSGLGQQTRSKFRIEGTRHGQDRQVLGGDSAVLTGHVRVQRVPGLGNGSAQDASIAGTHGVLVFQVGAQGVGRTVDLAALGARPRVCGANSHF